MTGNTNHRQPSRRRRGRRGKARHAMQGNGNTIPPVGPTLANRVSGFPATRRCKFFYSEDFKISGAADTVKTYVFRANSPWDPQWTAGGHSAMGWSTYEDKYKRFVVERGKMSCVVHTSDRPLTVGVYLSTSATTEYTKAWQFIEARRGNYATLVKGFTQPAIVTSSFDARAFFSLHDVVDAQALIGGGTSQVATQEALYNIYAQGYGEEWNMQGYVNIEFDVIFSDPQDIAAPVSMRLPVHDDDCKCMHCTETRAAANPIEEIPYSGESWFDLSPEGQEALELAEQ